MPKSVNHVSNTQIYTFSSGTQIKYFSGVVSLEISNNYLHLSKRKQRSDIRRQQQSCLTYTLNNFSDINFPLGVKNETGNGKDFILSQNSVPNTDWAVFIRKPIYIAWFRFFQKLLPSLSKMKCASLLRFSIVFCKKPFWIFDNVI